MYVPLACLGPIEIRISDALELELWMIVSSIVDAETELRFSTSAVNAEPPLQHLPFGCRFVTHIVIYLLHYISVCLLSVVGAARLG